MTTEPTKPTEDWSEFSDAELRGRLMRRGVEAVAAKGLVEDRMSEFARGEIDEILGKVYLDASDEPIRFEIPFERRARR